MLEKPISGVSVPAWLLLGVGVYVLVMFKGHSLLNDSDTYWQIAVGQWILDHHTFPQVDVYSFTKAGEPWISSSWLSQVLFATSYNLAGWAGPVVLTSTFIAITFALLTYILCERIPARRAIIVTLVALILSGHHFLARPHVLVMPVMLAWAYGLLSASERGRAPSFWLLPLIALWANLHGGFVFGLVLVAAFAIEALWNCDPAQRKTLALRWLVFGTAALVACCATPYGWGSILASRKILDLGELLHLITEWKPPDFGRLGMFEITILTLIAGALYGGVKLSPPRIALVAGLLHMALAHSRNIEMFALLLPLVLLAPVASQFKMRPLRPARMPVASLAVLLTILGGLTWMLAANAGFVPPQVHSPATAVDALKASNAKRVLNDRDFGGYLISRQIPVFVDGRAELYGEVFTVTHHLALHLTDVNRFLDILKTWNIDAVLLKPSTPAAGLLDHVGDWQRVYSDSNAVLYVRAQNIVAEKLAAPLPLLSP